MSEQKSEMLGDKVNQRARKFTFIFINTGLAGLSITYAFIVIEDFSWLILRICSLEINCVSLGQQCLHFNIYIDLINKTNLVKIVN